MGHRHSFSMIECVIATAITGVMLTAVLQTVAAARTLGYRQAERGRALLLAQELMTEILAQEYADPTSGPGTQGLEAGEEGAGNRGSWDDVDDYEGWSVEPPQNKDGSAIAWATHYRQEVRVGWVQADDLATPANNETGVKRIEVTVLHTDRPLVTLTAFRTIAWLVPERREALKTPDRFSLTDLIIEWPLPDLELDLGLGELLE